MAALGLDAPDGEHRRLRGVGVVRALHQAFDDVGDLPAGAELDPVAQAGAGQCVVDGDQTFGQRRSDVAGEFRRRGAGPAFGAVDDDEVGRDTLVEHGLADGEEPAPRPGAELAAGGFPAGELPRAATNRTSSRGVVKTRCYGGERTSCPAGHRGRGRDDDAVDDRPARTAGVAVVPPGTGSRRNTRSPPPTWKAASRRRSGRPKWRSKSSVPTGSSCPATRRAGTWRRGRCCGCGTATPTCSGKSWARAWRSASTTSRRHRAGARPGRAPRCCRRTGSTSAPAWRSPASAPSSCATAASHRCTPTCTGCRRRGRGESEPAVWPESPHGFVGMTPPTGLPAQQRINAWVKALLGG